MKFANQLVIILLSLFIWVGCKSDQIDLSGKTKTEIRIEEAEPITL